MLIVLYLGAIVLANVVISHFGPVATPYMALLCIGLDITTRDKLHEKWHGKNLWVKMIVLILTGSLISAGFNAGRIALASFIAFLLSGLADALTYSILYKRRNLVKINSSNIVSSAVDSILFPTIAFGSIMPGIIAAQFLAKVVGGYIWSVIYGKSKWTV